MWLQKDQPETSRSGVHVIKLRDLGYGRSPESIVPNYPEMAEQRSEAGGEILGICARALRP